MGRILRGRLFGLVVIVGSGLILAGCMSVIMPTEKDVSREINLTKEITFKDGYEKIEKACEEIGSQRSITASTTQISSDTSVTERMCPTKRGGNISISV